MHISVDNFCHKWFLLPEVHVRAVVDDLLKNGSRLVKLQTLTVLWDRIYGKPKQDVTVAGGIVHAHTRDPFLASLPKEALEMLARSYDEVVAKYALPAPQDGPYNQTKSNTDANVIDVECEDVHTVQVPQNASNSEVIPSANR